MPPRLRTTRLLACALALPIIGCGDPSDDEVIPVIAAPTAPTVPAPYQGTFAADVPACTAPGDESLLTIGSATITFHESTGPILGVAPAGDGIALTARLTGEGETREATYRFGLSADGNTLTDLDGGFSRVRCPAEPVAGSPGAAPGT